MMDFPSVLIQGGAWAMLTVLCAAHAPASPAPGGEQGSVPRGAQDSFERSSDGTAKVSGTVLENRRDCTRDGVCRLRVRAGSIEVLVRYNPGEAPCLNTAAARVGIKLEAGQRVQAFGHFIDFGSEQVIDTCPSTAFYIKSAE